jgi:N-acetylglucosamine-6-phosphate deacetylase
MRIQARHYATGELIQVECADGVIRSIGPPTSEPPDIRASWIAPAFFDLQINGCSGYGFNSPNLTVDRVRHITAVCRSHGIAGFCPTLITNDHESLLQAFKVLGLVGEIEAIHLEGPYISPEDGPRGAHPRRHVRPPDWDEFRRFQEAAAGRIRLVTLAPELDGALPFIETLVESGIVVAIGHTAASPSRIDEAVRAGARLSTHLGNGAHALLPRHDNYIWAQLADDRLWASIISDGWHLPVSVLRCFLRIKTAARLILTCDASSLAGLSPGRYREWDQDLEVQGDGRIAVAGTGYLAGSGAFTDACVRHALSCLELSLPDAIDMAGKHARELLGLPVWSLEPGAPVNLILFENDGGLRVTGTLVKQTVASASLSGVK